MIYRIRYNKTAGQAGRGSPEHVWRVFDENNKEYICKKVLINKPAWTEKDRNDHDWNFECEGEMHIDREKSWISII
jgi:hypothetical protein